jgi:OOP family OmpA-OmpF porin
VVPLTSDPISVRPFLSKKPPESGSFRRVMRRSGTTVRRHSVNYGTAAMKKWLIVLIGTLCGVAVHRTAWAQQRTFKLDRAELSGMPDDGLVVFRPYMPEKTTFYGAAALGYTLNPLRASTLTDDSATENAMDNVVQHQLTTYLAGGIQAAERVAFGAYLPIYLVTAGGEDPSPEVGEGLDRGSAFGDLRFDARVKIFENDARKFRAGVGASFFIPTGNSFRFASDDQTTAFIYGNAEYDLGGLLVSGHIGPHFRPQRAVGGQAAPISVLGIGSELRWAAGVFIPLRDNELRLGGTLWGTTGIGTNVRTDESTFFASENTDLEWLAEVRATLIKDNPLYFSGGAGTRLAAGYGAPDIRILAMIGTSTTLSDTDPGQARSYRKAPKVAMRDKDTDGDGYPDDIVMCPPV